MSTQDAIDEIKGLMAKGDSVSIEKILDKFIIMDKNLILKTDIENPKAFTILRTMEDQLKVKGLKRSYATLHSFCEWYIQIRVSNKRLSRKELLDAISAIRKEQTQQTIGSMLLGWNKKE